MIAELTLIEIAAFGKNPKRKISCYVLPASKAKQSHAGNGIGIKALNLDFITMSTNLDFQIRRAVEADALEIALLLHTAFVEYKPLYTPGGFAATVLTPEQVVTRMQEGPVWVVLHDDLVVATGAAVPKDAGLYIRGMAVAPEWRGGRIGELLLHEVERFARETGEHRLFLSTTPFLARAIRLYEKWGFQRTAKGPHDLFGTPLFTMEKFSDDIT